MTEEIGQPLVPVLAVVGTGLIGGSFAAALRRVGQLGHVIGVDNNTESQESAIKLGLVDEYMGLLDAVAKADLVFLATPLGAMPAILEQIAPVLPSTAILTDAGSTKASVASLAHEILGDKYLQFIPGHPIAGSEMVGPQAADAMLFHGRKVVLTPYADTPGDQQHKLIRIWEACGARVQIMAPADHDRAMASVSHLPHFLSAAYMAQVALSDDAPSRLNLAGTGFRDFTRIAAGSSEVWRDIFKSNRSAVLHELDEFNRVLADLKSALENHTDDTELEKILEQAAMARRFWGGRSQI